MDKIKKSVYRFIEKEPDEEFKFFDYFIIILVLVNIVSIIIESFDSLPLMYKIILNQIEIFSIIVFTIEYLLKIWTAEYKFPNCNGFISKLKYMISPTAIIDLLSILPFYIPMIIPMDLRVIRILRLTRLLRVFKLTRYSGALNLVKKVLKDRKNELLITIFLTFVLLLVASTLMYYIEHDAQPDKFPDIITSFWWAVATLTTVGYGDVFPITGWGRLLSGIIAMLGIGLVALPTSIISTGFMDELNKQKETKQKIEEEKDKKCFCPYCGNNIKH